MCVNSLSTTFQNPARSPAFASALSALASARLASPRALVEWISNSADICSIFAGSMAVTCSAVTKDVLFCEKKLDGELVVQLLILQLLDEVLRLLDDEEPAVVADLLPPPDRGDPVLSTETEQEKWCPACRCRPFEGVRNSDGDDGVAGPVSSRDVFTAVAA